MDRYERLTRDLEALGGVKQSIGVSALGRELWMVRFGEGPLKLLMTGALHGREWVASDLLQEAIVRLSQDYPYRRLSLTIVPMVNPDGVVAAQSQADRPHKERQKSNARGVDLNRNFDSDWGTVGVDPEPDYRDANYPGAEAFSEPETRSLRDLISESGPQYVIDWHARGGLIDGFGPRGEELARVMAGANGYGLVRNMHYPLSGTLSQWVRQRDPEVSAVNVEIKSEEEPDLEANVRAIRAALEWLEGLES